MYDCISIHIKRVILKVPCPYTDLVWLNITLATVGKFFNSAAFGVAYIYSAELVPTSVRNVAVGTSSVCARIGSALAPFIVDLLVSPSQHCHEILRFASPPPSFFFCLSVFHYSFI